MTAYKPKQLGLFTNCPGRRLAAADGRRAGNGG